MSKITIHFAKPVDRYCWITFLTLVGVDDCRVMIFEVAIRALE